MLPLLETILDEFGSKVSAKESEDKKAAGRQEAILRTVIAE